MTIKKSFYNTDLLIIRGVPRYAFIPYENSQAFSKLKCARWELIDFAERKTGVEALNFPGPTLGFRQPVACWFHEFFSPRYRDLLYHYLSSLCLAAGYFQEAKKNILRKKFLCLFFSDFLQPNALCTRNLGCEAASFPIEPR